MIQTSSGPYSLLSSPKAIQKKGSLDLANIALVPLGL
jgi:hypothetical protein